MITPTHRPIVARLNAFSRGASLFTVLVGLLVLIGWALDSSLLKSVLPTLVTMKVNTALAFVLAGTALWLFQTGRPKPRHPLAYLFPTIVLLIGACTLSEYVFG